MSDKEETVVATKAFYAQQRLEQAAPRLLAALQKLLVLAEEVTAGIPEIRVIEARAAIKEATGE